MAMRRLDNERSVVHHYIINGGSGGRGGTGQSTGGAGGTGMGPTFTYEIRAENFIMNNMNHGAYPTAIYLLQNAVAMDALYNSAVSLPRDKLHLETHTELLDNLYQRATETKSTCSIWWLYGPAGAGKSTVMRALCQRLHGVGKLGGTFFFKRGHTTCGNAKMLFATLAYQLTLCGQELRDLIAQSVDADSSVFWRDMEVQLRTLILEPCASLQDASTLVLLIDGLDECEGHNVQKEILRLMGSATANHSLPLRIIIASRPEPQLQEIFQEESFGKLVDSIDIEDPHLVYRSETYPTGSDDKPAAPVTSAPTPAVSRHLLSTKCSGRRRALCIGINYKGQSLELSGAIHDAKYMMNFLVRFQGYANRDIVVLTDDSPNSTQPTRENMINAMRWLVKDAKPHDSFCFFYSGLGGQTRKSDGDKENGYNEAIYPLDFKRYGNIEDDDMHRIMVKPLPAGCRLTAVFDSRNSTPILDLPYVYNHRGCLQDNKVDESVRTKKGSSADVTSWSTRKDHQARPQEDISRGGGAMTYAFLQAIQADPHQSYKERLQSLHSDFTDEPPVKYYTLRTAKTLSSRVRIQFLKMFSKAFSALILTALAVSASPALQARQSCPKTYTVVSGDTCAAIESRTGVSDSQLHALNPSINSGCTSSLPQQQRISPNGCTKTYTVVSGDTCAAIESRTGISDSQLHSLNPSINSGCTNLQIGQVLCVSGSGSPPPSTGFSGLATYYDPDGNLGACGKPLQNNDFIVALGTGHWDSGSHCGQTVNVSCAYYFLSPPSSSSDKGKTIKVVAQDLCPGCQGANGIDLSEGAIAALDSNYKNDGVISVVWSFA
ncbi:hypothetical protein MSAN_02210800 [Mycena sanguinolenta]|uniref:Uncharacterized protein n=1 Tax=Mycena sanguinolenta TaxID=230812 RepID=A0A8H7CJU6_9AGAR|nr:hypothetical protein MSAN_02210800 [Mycena sanguinolenta]